MSRNNLILENLTSVVAQFKHVDALTHVLKAVESSLDEYIRSARRILEVIKTSRQGRMHLSLLTSEQLKPVYRDIQDHHSEIEFPIPGPQVDLEELSRIVIITAIYKKEIPSILVDATSE